MITKLITMNIYGTERHHDPIAFYGKAVVLNYVKRKL